MRNLIIALLIVSLSSCSVYIQRFEANAKMNKKINANKKRMSTHVAYR